MNFMNNKSLIIIAATPSLKLIISEGSLEYFLFDFVQIIRLNRGSLV